VLEHVAIKAQVGEREVEIGGVSWLAGTPVVAVRDVYMPEEVDAWASFPGGADQPVLRMKMVVRQGIPCFTRVGIEASASGSEVTGAHLGQVRDNLEWWREVIVRRCAQAEPRDHARVPSWADDAAAAAAVKTARRGAPRKATPARHERVANIYAAHVDGKPIEAIQDAFRSADGSPVPYRTAARYVQDARKAGYLSPTTRGKKQV
jgi:hypothetical protein